MALEVRYLLIVLCLVGSNLASSVNRTTINKRSSQILWKLDNFPNADPLKYFKPHDDGFYNKGSLSTFADPEDPNRDVIRVFYQKGTYSSIQGYYGAQFYSRPISAHTSLTFSYQLYFSPGFDFVRGGKLPGLAGGEEATCSGGRHSETCFSARLMWRREGDGEIYAYIPQQVDDFCERPDAICSPTIKGTSLGRSNFRWRTGVWMKVSEHVTLNDVGKDNGIAKLWIDDKLVYEGHNIRWRVRDDVKITSIFFSTFFGGNTPEWAATDNCFTYFKEFVLSTGDKPPVVG
ncbi:hypothetical protein SNE40_015843 [Patella caerulea]|uniref:Polysaccharide lyase 14 domain-containing protein n=1 Tax=Patella caerulea TaxID=87958 RepID=A0AAN8JN09_PATCE